MPEVLPLPIRRLIEEFQKLPGIGPKMAARLTFFLLHAAEGDVEALGSAVYHLRRTLQKCRRCANFAEDRECTICADPKRQSKTVAVVETALDVVALERTGEYRGLYHILGGAINPVEGIGPDELNIAPLLERAKKEGFSEIILATNPTLEGEATALYLAKVLKEGGFGGKVTRIARGLPIGADLEYADELTLTRALEGRKEF